MRIVLAVIGGLVLVAAGLFLTLVFGMRTGNRTVLDAVRNMNRKVTNPQQLKTAGKAGASASIIRHRGRTSGRAYETPVGVLVGDDGFEVALPYGPETDWVRNIMAAGSSVLVHDGQEYNVDRFEVVPIETTRYANEDPMTRVFGVKSALLLRH